MLSISFHCICGERFVVDDRIAGRSATCTICETRLTVPLVTDDFADTSEDVVSEQSIRPRRRKKTPEAPVHVALRNTDSDGFEPAYIVRQEMASAVVVALACMLIGNGLVAVRELMNVALFGWFWSYSGISEADIESHQYLMKVFVIFFVSAVLHGSVAGSVAGILLWRRYAVFLALISSVVLWLFQWLILRDFSSLVPLNVLLLIASGFMMFHLRPRVWKKLMKRRSGKRG
jgi:hypothetical protein